MTAKQRLDQIRRIGLVALLIGLSIGALSHKARAETVRASWYGGVGEHLARRTADGEIFRPNALTAAHRTLPFGTRLSVSYRGRNVIVTITDRGPARFTGRSLDLSRGAASVLGMLRIGVATVSIQRIN